MTPHCVSLGDIKPEHLARLADVRRLVEQLPDGLTCHAVCDAVAARFPELRRDRGYFNGWDHSWLWIAEKVIIDPYPWACGSGPMLVVIGGCTPWTLMYESLEDDG